MFGAFDIWWFDIYNDVQKGWGSTEAADDDFKYLGYFSFGWFDISIKLEIEHMYKLKKHLFMGQIVVFHWYYLFQSSKILTASTRQMFYTFYYLVYLVFGWFNSYLSDYSGINQANCFAQCFEIFGAFNIWIFWYLVHWIFSKVVALEK